MNTRTYILALSWLLFAGLFVSCQKDELSDTSIFEDELETKQNALDVWIEKNYLNPYNVEFKYRMDDVESAMSNNLVPIAYDNAVVMARIVKHAWFEAYDEVGGIDFTRQYAPKVIHLIGSYQWNPNGTMTLGYAEGGLKITLVGGNWLDVQNVDALKEMYFTTMHHEFAHILHQTINYPVEYRALSEGHYSPSGWTNRTDPWEYAPYGFVTNYGSSEPDEDMAEITACYLSWTQAQWDELRMNAMIDENGNPAEGWNIIEKKISIMKTYMMDNYGIDMDVLRTTIERRYDEIRFIDLSVLE
jgi:substrate import-associated zinc metallohydrolase lipoprotein